MNDYVFSEKEFLSGLDAATEEVLGRKGRSIAILTHYKVPTPSYFIISTKAFRDFIKDVSNGKVISSLGDFKNYILETPFSKKLADEINRGYRSLSGLGKSWVAVRSSVSAPKYQNFSFSGRLDTFLNIRGERELEIAIREIYASLFSEVAYTYFVENKIDYKDISLAIIVQKMVQAEVSGVAYTYDPVTFNTGVVSVEAVFGLGDVISEGLINPDVYLVSKTDKTVLEKKILPQQWMKVRKIGDVKNLSHNEKVQISKVWQYAQKLDDRAIAELCAILTRVEQIFSGFQVVEWIIEGNRIHILQVKSTRDKGDMLLEGGNVEKKEKSDFINKKDSKTNYAEKLLLSGIPCGYGDISGQALVVAPSDSEETLKGRIKSNTVLIVEELSPLVQKYIYDVAGIITDFGSNNSDVALVAREAKIPVLSGTRIASSVIRSGDYIRIDGITGAVYLLDKDSDATTDTNARKDAEESEISIKDIARNLNISALEQKKYKLFMPGCIAWQYGYSNKIRTFKDKEELIYGIDLKSKQLIRKIKSLKEAKLHTDYPLSILLKNYDNAEDIRAFKQALLKFGIKRTKSFNIFARIDSLRELMQIKDYIGKGLDGVILNILSLKESYGLSDKDIVDLNFVNLFLNNLKENNRKTIGVLIKEARIQDSFIFMREGVTTVIIEKLSQDFSKEDFVEFLNFVGK